MLKDNELKFEVKLPHEDVWTEISIELSYLKKQDFTCDETVSMDIMEYVYAENSKFEDNQDEIIFNVDDYWNDIVMVTHKALYS